ncbi:TonB-dependent receptor plug domain-containing protein [Flavobacterium sp. GA093]|uniref:TonB-dependent receptor plug domain-containing protein n=1 Tax=Flavobacterium hydrocarbonoxydans TaxID=2683249 RepID=A0A6I4NTQ6_9FLAO|nr:carboxypeptidase-like regulatory domain-containing protein [Flavobacterium hydrocarbonoxydans]MWB94414.1 TonB-dependent receptor plug domain-containing protein [Flavobacterium hydrocarbonoxydans]
MKKILFAFLLFSTTLFAQQNDKKWAKVINYENEGKIKSSNEIVVEIYKKAVENKDEVQMIKCFFYQSKYLQTVDENAQTKIINNLKSEINRVSIPSKAILNFVYAKCLNDYYNRNNSKIRSRTNTNAFDEDFLTWTEATFKNQIGLIMKKTLENETVLKSTSLEKYEAIFDFFTLEKFKKENLFDYLLKENLAFYKQKVHQWEVVKSDFTPYTKQLLGKSTDFIKVDFGFATNENLRTVLSLYQNQESNNPSGDNQLERMQYCKNNLLDSDEAYFPALTSLQKETKEAILIQNIQLEKASVLSQKASKETHPDYNIQAVFLLDSIIAVNNRSNAYKLAVQQKGYIQSKSLNIQLQKYSYSDENTRALIRYKNVSEVKVSFYKINQKQLLDLRDYSKKGTLASVIIQKGAVIVTQNYTIKNKNDFFEYTTEVLLPNLKTGSYLVYFESDSETKDEKAFSYETITVSNLAVLASQNISGETFQVLDRKTGKPLENVTVKSKHYNLKTNKNGVASYSQKKFIYNNNDIELSTKNDTVLVQKNYLSYFNEYSKNDNENEDDFKGKVDFYLDRAIYRPGQTVYYKGIAIQKKNNETKVVAKTTFKIIIQDADYNDFKEFDVITNEFGSFSGEFVLPKNGLTGNFTIEADEPDTYENDIDYNKGKDEHAFWENVDFEDSAIDFRVEEYKRPKFEITFEPKKESFKVNELIKVQGSAKAFAGSNISDAVVKYTVTRYSNYFRGFSGPDEETEIIITGETKTDASGKFSIDFTAIPPKNTKKEQLPVFNYHIKTTVTDINGETHDAETDVKVGYHDLVLGTSVPFQIETKNKNEILLTSTNLNGEFLAVKGEIKIFYKSPFSGKFKPRVWPVPDFETIKNADFERLFPYEQNEKITTDTTTTLLYSKKIDTEKDKKIVLDFISNYKSGNYKIVFSAKDSFDNTIKSSTDFQITQSKDKFNTSTLFSIKQINEDPKKDGFVLLKITSVIPELYFSVTGNYDSKVFFEKTEHLENNEKIIKIALKKEFEKHLKIGIQSVFENTVFNKDIDVFLKTEAPKLEFTTETFRSKLQPGTNENWSFKLKSTHTKNEAEVLASMYDSSLDQFAASSWNTLGFYDYSYNSSNIKSDLGFEKTSSYLQNLNIPKNRIELHNETAKLIWFGFDFNNANNSVFLQREYQKQLRKKAEKPINAKLISGIVTDESNMPLPGVSITIEGTQRGTSSDFDGYYEIEAVRNEELVFSYIGFKNQSIIVKDAKIIDIVLTEDHNSLEEVVVTGYGIQTKKASLSASISRISTGNFLVGADSTSVAGVVAGVQIRGAASLEGKTPLYVVDGQIINDIKNIDPATILSVDVLKDDKATALYGSRGANGVIIINTKKALEELTQVKARKNLSETAFFLPNLRTDADGKVSFNFTSPEALTSWKLRLLAHNKKAITGYLEKIVLTQKELMILPNFPRFFREKDTIVISAKISNITGEAKTGIAMLQFFDAATMQPIDNEMLNAQNVKNFTIPAFGNTTANWTITIPEGLQGVQYKILAKSGDYSDGEENILPVLTNNMLVTESIPIWVRENSKKEYTFENLKNNTSSTLKNHQFTFEYTSNPTWITIQSLPYLMEYEHECAEQTFARFYANALASDIIGSNPKIATVFEKWRKSGNLNSKLEENEELKSIILAETPWLNDAKSEDEKKKNLGLLFDLEKMKNSQEATFDKLKQKQKSSGGFPWFEGSDESEYITRHILAGLGHLSKLSKDENNTSKMDEIAKTGIPFLDRKFLDYHKIRTKNAKATNKLIWVNPNADLHYFYTRSFYLEKHPLSDTLKKASKMYFEAAKKDWLTYSLYEKGLAALALNRFGEKETAKKIIESLKETSSNNEDWGMYWIANKAGWYWYQAPIETQALLIEAFAEVTQDTKSVDAMKVWLLKNKQTKNWPTTKSTTEAIYALLMQGTDWTSVKDNTIIKLGNEKIITKKLSENEKEAETGYIKLNWKAEEVKKEMASISIENKSKVPGYGGVYWQYFEDLDKIQNNSGAVLSVSKELYLKKSTLKGDELEKISSKNELKTGDLVTVRLIISSKEDVEFVHLKDMRASCFEPVAVLSEYQYKDGLGYYRSTKDAATHFFFDQINKGTYILEYDIRVNNSGEFSNGITTIQSMYAPEFASHTKGIRVKVKQ